MAFPLDSHTLQERLGHSIRLLFAGAAGIGFRVGHLELFASQVEEVSNRSGCPFTGAAVGASADASEHDLVIVLKPEGPEVAVLNRGRYRG